MFIIPTLFAGGAERIISFVCQNINSSKFNVTLVVIGFEKDNKYKTDEVNVVYLNKARVLHAVPNIIKFIFKSKPNVVLSSISHLNIIMGLISILFPNVKFIARQATINKVAKNYRVNRRKFSLSSLINLGQFSMNQLDRVICQSNDMKSDFIGNYNSMESKITIIQNPITNADKVKEYVASGRIKRLVTVGRLGKIKGHERLINILSKLKIPFHYTIIGSGPLEKELFDQIDYLGLTESVTHIPHTNNVNSYLKKNDYFLQGSFSEGFPNALLESCVVGTPVIAFNVPGGTKEIVENGINGFLVEDEAEFLEKLNHKQDWNPSEIRESVYKKFNKEKIINDYEQLFIDILK